MAYEFTDGKTSPYRSGGLYFGETEDGHEVGMVTEKHAITFAPTGTGKGATLIIPNLRRWPHSIVCIDPKGENAERTWQAREAMGQKVVVIDPFGEADIPARLRGSFNPLLKIDPYASGAREALEVIADGIVKTHDPRHTEWVDGSKAIIAGLLAFVVETASPDSRSFAAMRTILTLPDAALHDYARTMVTLEGCGKLAREAGNTIATALASEKGMERDFLGGARRATRFLDSPEIAFALGTSTFDLSELKNGKTTVFLVLPFDYIDNYSAFLRLFVRCSMSAMGRTHGNGQCLFLLDEFFALGKLDTVRSNLAQMRSYGVKLWPFLQDLGQLQDLYGNHGASTFFANADAQIFFGMTDGLTAEHVSKVMDRITVEDIGAKPVVARPAPIGDWEYAAANRQPSSPMHFPAQGKHALAGHVANAISAAAHQSALDGHAAARADIQARENLHRAREATERAEYEHAMKALNMPRFSPHAVKELVAKKKDQSVARSMIVVGQGGDIFNIRPVPYFEADQRAAKYAEHVAISHTIPLNDWYRAGKENFWPYAIPAEPPANTSQAVAFNKGRADRQHLDHQHAAKDAAIKEVESHQTRMTFGFFASMIAAVCWTVYNGSPFDTFGGLPVYFFALALGLVPCGLSTCLFFRAFKKAEAKRWEIHRTPFSAAGHGLPENLARSHPLPALERATLEQESWEAAANAAREAFARQYDLSDYRLPLPNGLCGRAIGAGETAH